MPTPPPTEIEAANLQLVELNQVEASIVATQSWLATLQGRQATLTARLDEVTRPAAAAQAPADRAVPPRTPPRALDAIKLAKPLDPSAKTVGPGVLYEGAVLRRWTAIDIFVALLQLLWERFPDKREAIAAALAARGTARRYVARSCTDLFRYQSAAFARKHSRPLADGWVVDTNLNCSRIHTLSRVAVRAAGLQWDSDVKVFWRPTRVE